MTTTAPATRIFMTILPCILAFLASFCIMVVELVAGRLIARHVGMSLYTWTSVIGVILGGITIGNLFGGRLADYFNTRKLTSVLFFISAITCAAIPLLNDVVGDMGYLKEKAVSWPFRIFIHVTLVFLWPAVALGFIGPAVAKMALDQGRETGRTVGNVYAWGALGSIVGTFFTGFYLVATVGSKATMFAAAIFLALVGLALAPLSSRSIAMTFIFIPWFIVLAEERSDSTWQWSLTWKPPSIQWPFVQEKLAEDTIYADESAYSFVKVSEDKVEKHRELILDNLIHAYLAEEVTKLDYEYEEIYAAITRKSAGDRKDIHALFLGGGGYIFPRYVRAHWPESTIEVAEIDPGVTRAIMSHFRLSPLEAHVVGDPGFVNTVPESPDFAPADFAEEEAAEGEANSHRIAIHHLDARNHVEDLWKAKHSGDAFEPFDFIYGDAFNDYSVPFHLVTREFNDKLKDILTPGTGIYMINIIDIYDYGRFLGAVNNTMREVFPHVYVIATNEGGPDEDADGRDTFIVVGSFRELELEGLAGSGGEKIQASLLEEKHLKKLVDRSRGVVLRDDYSPVENMLGEVVRRNKEERPEVKPEPEAKAPAGDDDVAGKEKAGT
jgi:spermidine synthase